MEYVTCHKLGPEHVYKGVAVRTAVRPMDKLSDETLLDLYFAGDADAFQVFFERHSGRVVGYAMNKGLRREIALEVSQDAFLRLHKSIHAYEKGRPALPWFFTIVHNCVIDAMRQAKSLTDLKSKVFEERRVVGQANEVLTSDHAASVLSALSEEQKQVFEMRVFGELSFAEISEQTGKNETALRKMFERTRRKLKDLWSGEA